MPSRPCLAFYCMAWLLLLLCFLFYMFYCYALVGGWGMQHLTSHLQYNILTSYTLLCIELIGCCWGCEVHWFSIIYYTYVFILFSLILGYIGGVSFITFWFYVFGGFMFIYQYKFWSSGFYYFIIFWVCFAIAWQYIIFRVC